MDATQFFITAAIYTTLGYWFAKKQKSYASFAETKRITQETIDTLISLGYVKTVGEGDNIELVKVNKDI
jgi:hypothetical protein